MAEPEQEPQDPEPTPPDTTSVHTLITSNSELAKALGITPNAVLQWKKYGYIPSGRLKEVADFYWVSQLHIMHLVEKAAPMENNVVRKPIETLPTLLRVRAGELTMNQAARQLGITVRSLLSVDAAWGNDLQLLYETLESLKDKKISLAEAAETLNLTKGTINGMRRKFGYAPGALRKVKARRMEAKNEVKKTKKETVFDVIAGVTTVKEASETLGMSERTVFRWIDKQSPELQLRDLTHWPNILRLALVQELKGKAPKFAQKWMKLLDESRVILRDSYKMPPKSANLGKEPLKRLLIAILTDEATLTEVAVARHADEGILTGLFSGDLQPLGLDFDTLMGLPFSHRLAVAEIFVALSERRRRFRDV